MEYQLRFELTTAFNSIQSLSVALGSTLLDSPFKALHTLLDVLKILSK